MRILGLSVVVLAGCALTEPLIDLSDPPPAPTGPVEHMDVCPHGPDHPGNHCMAKVVTEHGRIKASLAPAALRPVDLQSAYHIDPTLGAGVTVAVVDAFGYPALESDLATYRQEFGLPPCSVASGCLTIVNQDGKTSPLPGLSPPMTEDWTQETALDVDMVSAACPLCKIVVVQTITNGPGLDIGTKTAYDLGVTTISNSWGANEFGDETTSEFNFDMPGVAVFVSSGDNAFAAGPQYPATSAFVIAVGGTSLVGSATDPRGWTETAWADAGSSCSMSIPQPRYQRALGTNCTFRAAADISAVADPNTGVAVFNAANGGWLDFGGTSAASPLSAAIFAAAGHGDAIAAFAYKHPDVFNDVTSGSNGSCSGRPCNAEGGWDGPTGLGTPDQGKIKAVAAVAGPAVTITFPADMATLAAGFTIEATADVNTSYIDLVIDGTKLGATSTVPYTFSAPSTLADGAHTVQLIAFDESHNSTMAQITVTTGTAPAPPKDNGGCQVGGGGSPALILAGLLALRRRRR